MRFLFFIGVLLYQLSANAGPWFEKSNFGGEARHRSSSFSIGNFGYVGLGHINAVSNIAYEDFWKYDPSSDCWTQISNYPEGKIYHSAAFVINDKAYVGTGRLQSGAYTKKFYCYDPTSNLWTAIADLPGAARRGAISFEVNGRGYVGTGQTNSGYASDFYEYNPQSNSWASKAALPAAGRTSSVAFSINSYGFVGTGQTSSGSINDFFRYDPATDQWTQRAPVGPTNRQEATGFSVNGKGYIGTGDDYSSGNSYGDFWEYDDLTNTWIQIQDFEGTSRRYMTSFVIDTRAYVSVGTNGTNFKDLWLFDQVLSVLERQFQEVNPTVYPNPSEGELTIDLKSLPADVAIDDIEIVICDPLGRVLKKNKFEQLTNKISLDSFEKGWFILVLRYKGECFYSTKIIVY